MEMTKVLSLSDMKLETILSLIVSGEYCDTLGAFKMTKVGYHFVALYCLCICMQIFIYIYFADS